MWMPFPMLALLINQIKHTMEFTFEQKRTLIIEWCSQLAQSQGFYGRLLRDFYENEEYLNNIVEAFDGRDMLDFVLFIES